MKVLYSLSLFAALLLCHVSPATAQLEEPDTVTYKVRATSGEFPYFPEVGSQPFEYTVDRYCEYCVIRIGGMTLSGKYTGDMFNRACEAIVPLSNGQSLRVVSTAGGHLDVHDGRSGGLLVRFSSGALKPPRDADSRQIEEYILLCIEAGMYPEF